MKTVSAIVFALAAGITLSAHALTTTDMFGHPATESLSQRTITINDNTKYINVTQRDIIKLTDGKNSVVWLFDGLKSDIPLSQIFPAAQNADHINVYVAPDPSLH